MQPQPATASTPVPPVPGDHACPGTEAIAGAVIGAIIIGPLP